MKRYTHTILVAVVHTLAFFAATHLLVLIGLAIQTNDWSIVNVFTILQIDQLFSDIDMRSQKMFIVGYTFVFVVTLTNYYLISRDASELRKKS